MTISHWNRQHAFSTSDINTDVLIVGGGYVGLSLAYWLTEYSPDSKITVIERTHCGGGASGRNAGFLTMGSAAFYRSLNLKWGSDKAREIFNFAQDSLKLVHQQIIKSSPEIKADKTTSLTLIENQQILNEWQSERPFLESLNFEWREAKKLASAFDKFLGAYENGPEYRVNPMQILSSLKKLLTTRKVNIIEQVAVSHLFAEGVVTEVNTIRAGKVILAMNGYMNEFHPVFKNVITPRRAQMLAVELENDFQSDSLHYDPAHRVYFRKTGEKSLIIGGKRLLDEAGEIGNYEKISPVIQQGLESYLKETLKLNYKVIHRWSGIMGFTEHELPISKKITADLPTYVIGGFSGHGMGLGFKSAQDLAEVVCDQKSQTFYEQFKKVEIKL